MADEQFQAKYKTAAEIRSGGAIGNLQDGPVVSIHGVDTRLVAWPGTGYQTEAVHVLTMHPGQETGAYTYDVSEEAMLCLAGRGEVQLHGEWRELRPGDIAYIPEGVAHAVRNPSTTDDLIVVTQITPAQFDLYEAGGFYNRALGTLNLTAIFKATLNAHRGELPPSEMAYHDHEPEVRAQNLPKERVRREGALFNAYLGQDFQALGVPGRLVLWPAAGTRQAGFNYGFAPARATDALHIHPISDECLVVWEGVCEGYTAAGYAGGTWAQLETYDAILAPCGVLHGHRSGDTPSVMGGFASPPQPDLLFDSGAWKDGVFSQGSYVRLDPAETEGIAGLRAS
jgi:quercetin dioxygenase-like cupin family protein